MPEETDERRAVIRTALLTPSPLERYRTDQTYREFLADVVLIKRSESRHVLALGSPGADRVFDLAEQVFGEGGFTIEVEADADEALERELLRRGWRLSEEEPALVMLDPPTSLPSGPPGLTIRQVSDEAGLVAFRSLSGTSARWVPSLAAAKDPAVALFLGYVGDLPVASSRVARLGTVADINGVHTSTEFRRRGYGTALTWATVAWGAQRGCTGAMLTATSMGYPIYVRMGFQPVCTFRTYEPPTAQSTADSDPVFTS